MTRIFAFSLLTGLCLLLLGCNDTTALKPVKFEDAPKTKPGGTGTDKGETAPPIKIDE